MALNTIVGGVRGGIAFLTRLPVETGEADWDRFRSFPAAFPIIAYLVGAIASLPFLFGFSAPTASFGYLLVLVVLVGIPHLDGVADLGDAMAAHGEDATRRALKDTDTGVGAIVAVVVVAGGLVLAGLALATLPPLAAVGLVVAAEAGAKLGMATVACLGTAAHEGLGSAFTERADSGVLLGPIVATLPAALFAPLPAGLAAVAVGPLVAILLIRWANRSLGGVNGDVFGATNELGRVLALHVGVIAWTLW
ncbi:MAG: adenosylcobinamide-GDP ribazoletransferase [Natronomonas sp.]|uniref:adenosylcobinamide-GDP ribazoletransferase n=1 Tax=Natronomonas sp. TaxID=2184060 RepID=UPI002870136E|nr:adenosylcobinamide-GDP ribazoletransferase [Natronomonas sp.]MDR9430255.1 adenosylcobinamide-GDP ribazoletransferase [Natronomonas sp.]